MDDSQLLHDYVTTGSQHAFALLVHRHVDLVYAAARRQLRNETAAEEITHCVFVVLARKASTIYRGQVLVGWLLATTRYAIHNARTAETRRRRHEQRAAAMKPTSYDAPEYADGRTAPLLDEALARLSPVDRSAIAMRFFQNKSMREISMALDISEAAATKRVTRAVEKLRGFFARRGIAMGSAALSAELATHASPAAPSALAASIVSSAASGATAATSTGAIAVLSWLQTKLAATVAASVLVAAAAGAVAISANRSPATTASAKAANKIAWTLHATDIWMPYVPSTTPGTEVRALPNSTLESSNQKYPDYDASIDLQTKRDADPVVMIQSVATAPKGAGLMWSGIPADPYRGKRIRFAGWLKSEAVERAGVLSLQIYRGDNDDLYTHDEMDGHELTGTHDWQRFDIVSDVPSDATIVYARAMLMGRGVLWADGFEIAVVGTDVPTHDDHGWRSSGTAPAKYTTVLDQAERYHGRPTIRLSGPTAGRNDWIAYASTDHEAAPYAGKHVRFSAVLKSDNLVGRAGPFIRAVGPNDSSLKMDTQASRRPVTGSMGWMSYTTEMDVPEQSMGLCVGVNLFGSGTVWMDDVRLELIENR